MLGKYVPCALSRSRTASGQGFRSALLEFVCCAAVLLRQAPLFGQAPLLEQIHMFQTFGDGGTQLSKVSSISISHTAQSFFQL